MGRPRQFNPQTAIDVAMKVFWKRGYRATSIEQLVQATGVSRAGLYAEFGDKRALFQAAFEHYQKVVITPILCAMNAATADLSDVRHYLESLKNYAVTTGCLACSAVAELAACDEQADQGFALFTHALSTALRNALHNAANLGQLNGKDPNAVAARLLVVIVGGLALARVPSGQSLAVQAFHSALDDL